MIPPPNAGSNRDSDCIAGPSGCAHPPFAQHSAVGIVVEDRGKSEPLVDDLAQWKFYPAQIGRE